MPPSYEVPQQSRILVEQGAVLMGGLDETGLLNEGCVFVQVPRVGDRVSTSSDAKYEPLVGPVMVTKHPVLHPGDLRMLLAVDVPNYASIAT